MFVTILVRLNHVRNTKKKKKEKEKEDSNCKDSKLCNWCNVTFT